MFPATKIIPEPHCKELNMRKNVFIAIMVSAVLMVGPLACHAANWIKNNVDIPNKNVASNFYDSKSVKVRNKTLIWTEKTVLTDFGTTYYTKYLTKFPACKKNIDAKGEVTQHQIDFEIKQGKFRTVAKRNYNKGNELVCTDKDMEADLDTSWKDIPYQSPMYFREYELVTKYKLGNI